MLNIDKIFITHYNLLLERKERLKKILNFGNDIIWQESEPDDKEIEHLFLFSKEEWHKKTNSMNYGLTINFKNLTKSEISIAYKHFKIFEYIVENNIKTSLIFEDDVILINNFEKNFNNYLEKTPSNWDFIFIGNGCNLRIPNFKLIKGQLAYEKEAPATRCCDSYLINFSAAVKIYNELKNKITLPIDFELNYHIQKNNLLTYWWEPPIVLQGSQNGFFTSKVIK